MKYILFATIAAMALVVLYRDRVMLNPQHWIWEHYRPFKWWLLPHGMTGGVALFLGPRCNSPEDCATPSRLASGCGTSVRRWRQRGGTAGDRDRGDQVHAPLRLVVGSSGFGILFALTTVVGFTLARRHRIRDHQDWMTRSYADRDGVSSNALRRSVPWLGKIVGPAVREFETHSVSGLWLHIAFSLLAAELVLRYNRTSQPRPAKAMNAA